MADSGRSQWKPTSQLVNRCPEVPVPATSTLVGSSAEQGTPLLPLVVQKCPQVVKNA